MCIIQIWTTCTCSSAYKLVENQICVLRCMLRSHARNGNEFQTPGHRWLPAKRWVLYFKILVNPKVIRNSWNLAFCHGMAPDMLWYISCPFDRRRTRIMTANKGILKKHSCHFNISNICVIQTVCVRLTIHMTPHVLVLMAIGGAVWISSWLNGRRASGVRCAGWPRGVQAVLKCAGSLGSVPFDFHGRPPCSHPLH